MTAFLVCLVAALALGAGALVARAVAALPLAFLEHSEQGGRYARLGATPLPPRTVPPGACVYRLALRARPREALNGG